MKPTIPDGFVAKFDHKRYYDGDTVLPTGGATFVSIVEDVPTEVGREVPPRVVATGVAFCNARDNFNKRIGRDIALGRALKALDLR